MLEGYDKYLPEITERTALLISQALKSCGCDEWTYTYIEEDLYIREAESVKEFLDWIKLNIDKASMEVPFVENNFCNLYKNYFLKGISL